MKIKRLKSRKDVENYAVSLIVPLLDKESPIWDIEHPIKGKAHWSGHFYTYLEMYARPLWSLPFILKYRKKPIYIRWDKRKIRIEDWYKIGLIAGTDNGKDSYWGDYSIYGQMSTEIAPVALALYFGREWFWEPLSNKEKKQVASWLYKISSVYPIKTHRNNHYWFPILINLSLKRLGLRYHKEIIAESLKKLDNFYMGEGWFYDGTIGRYDYYIPWSHHLYPMIWMLVEDENEKGYKIRREMYIERVNKFLKYYPLFFDSNGLYVPWGRSLSYRFAAIGLLSLAVYNGCDIKPGLAKRITMKNINYFMNNGAEPGKKVTPGFTYTSYQNVERYISVSSSYWFTKGFLSLIMDRNHIFWASKEELLPSEKLNYYEYNINIDKAHLKIIGEPEINGVSVYNNSAYIKIGGFGSTNEFYGKFVYNSRSGFGTSTRDWVASDNMISLMTKDKLLTSHRAIFTDMGIKKDIYYSEHIPFSNDKNSKIKTALLPLREGFHIRVHKIKLTRPYIILEGGFSVGRFIDREIFCKGDNWIAVATESGISFIYTYINIDKIEFQVRKIHPDAHILYPLSSYPAYISKNELQRGLYFFASAFYFSSIKVSSLKELEKEVKRIIDKTPNLNMVNKNTLKVIYNKEYEIRL